MRENAVDNLGLLPEKLLARVSRHLSFDKLLGLARNLWDRRCRKPLALFRPTDDPPPLDFSAALDDDGGRSKDRTREHQRHLRKWIVEFESGTPFLELPEYSGGSKTFSGRRGCRGRCLTRVGSTRRRARSP